MKGNLAFTSSLLATLISTQSLASHQYANVTVTPIQQISVTNMLWNANGTGGAPGMTQTSVVVAFNNGGSHPCYTTTLAFEGYYNLSVGTGLSCVAAVTSVSFTPVAGPAGAVYTAPTNTSINGSYYTSQLIVSDNTDPVFDTTNGAVNTAGTVAVSYQGQFSQ